MRCIQCGTTLKERGILCKECIKEKYSCLGSYSEHTVLFCANCGKYKYKKQWKTKKAKDVALQEALLHHCTFIHKPTKKTISLELQEIKDNRQKGVATLQTTTTIEGNSIDETFDFPIKVTYTQCDGCARAKTSYFEGVMQLRGKNEEIIEEAYAFTQALIDKEKGRGLFITKTQRLKSGYDLYVTKQRSIPTLMKKLIAKFGASGQTHSQLFGRKDGKDLYRVNARIMLPPYSLGSLITFKNRLYRITKLGAQTKARNLQSGKAITLPKDAQVTAIKAKPTRVIVTKKYPQLEVLHPETYQSTTVQNPQTTTSATVAIAVIRGKVWLVDW